jgi:uncharacterized protein YjiS (DUF1127 family)
MESLWRAIKTWWLDYRTYRILTQLNDYQLKDIGLNRSDLGNDLIRPSLITMEIKQSGSCSKSMNT